MQGDYFIHFCTRSARKADHKLLNIAKSYNALILKAIFSRISLNLWNSLSTVTFTPLFYGWINIYTCKTYN